MQREPTDFIGWDFTFSSQAPRLEELKKDHCSNGFECPRCGRVKFIF